MSADKKLKSLYKAVGELIAEIQVETNRECYHDDAELFANDGITESLYMEDGLESVEWFVNEQLVESVWPHAKKHYKALIKK